MLTEADNLNDVTATTFHYVPHSSRAVDESLFPDQMKNTSIENSMVRDIMTAD